MQWHLRECPVCGGDLYEDDHPPVAILFTESEKEPWCTCLQCSRSFHVQGLVTQFQLLAIPVGHVEKVGDCRSRGRVTPAEAPWAARVTHPRYRRGTGFRRGNARTCSSGLLPAGTKPARRVSF